MKTENHKCDIVFFSTISQPKDNTKKDDDKAIVQFFQTLYGTSLKDGYVVLWTKQNRRSYFYAITDLEAASKMALSLRQDNDVYYGVGLQRSKLESGRGTMDTVCAIPGFWVDIDIQGGKHKKERLPPDIKSAMDLLDSFEMKPTLIVSSGGGLHVYWLFHNPLIINDEETRKSIIQLSKGFQLKFLGYAKSIGWELDDTSDISRLLRLPATFNHKQDKPVPVLINVHSDETRYEVSDFESFLKTADTEERDNPGGALQIVEGQRNTTLTGIAGVLRGKGLEYEEIHTELIKINDAQCKPPLSSEEINDIAKSISRYEPNQKENHINLLFKITDPMKSFHSPDGECFIEDQVNGHKETWRLGSKDFESYLSKRYYETHGKAPARNSISDVINILKATALYDCPEKNVNIRWAEYEDRIYLDLCDSYRNIVMLTKDNRWEIVGDSPVSFRRQKAMQSLPIPKRGGNISSLYQFININELSDQVLITAWLIGAMSPIGPYPILLLNGEQGSAKSTTSKIIRSLIDPSSSPLRTMPGSEKELMISAKNSWVLSFDNLSGLRHSMSDSLCRLSTGGGLATRKLYSDSDEVIFDAMRPIILNGIEEIANRSDLLDRSILINLPRILESKRKLEKELWDEFNKIKPEILGTLLDAFSYGVSHIKDVELKSLPRMADFARLVIASEPMLPWDAGKFMEFYRANRNAAAISVFDSDLVAIQIKDFLMDHKRWSGTASQLLHGLQRNDEDRKLQYNKSWPKTPSQLSGRIKRIMDPLRKIGIDVSEKKINGSKKWVFERVNR